MIRESEIGKSTAKRTGVAILKTLAYFDIFHYPLSKSEIKNFLGYSVNDREFNETLNRLVFEKVIFDLGEFYALNNNRQNAEKRLLGNSRAQDLLPRAARIGAFLYKFPYVKAVGISGSLSKNYADEKADIDFFIVTKANRLWLARSILHLFKKVTYLIGKQHLYCMNYFIDEDALCIQEGNIYTATEVVTVIPVAGSETTHRFLETNSWVRKWFPNYVAENRISISNEGSVFKRVIELLFKRKMGDFLDDFLFEWTRMRWEKKEKLGRLNMKGKIMSLDTGKHFSKSNPGAFQERIVGMFEDKIENFRKQWPQYFD